MSYLKVYIDSKLLRRVDDIEVGKEHIILTFADRGYIPRISRIRYHQVQLIKMDNGEIQATAIIFTKGYKRKKNKLYLKLAMHDVLMGRNK